MAVANVAVRGKDSHAHSIGTKGGNAKKNLNKRKTDYVSIFSMFSTNLEMKNTVIG